MHQHLDGRNDLFPLVETFHQASSADMDRNAAQEKAFVESEHLEIVQDNAATLQPTHYRPQSDAEKKLNKRVNLKLDVIVVTLLAIEFIVRDPSVPDMHLWLSDQYSSVASTRLMSASWLQARSLKTPTCLQMTFPIRSRSSRQPTFRYSRSWSSSHGVSV